LDVDCARAKGTIDKCSGPVLKINDHATGGRRTKDILGGPKGWGPKKKVANVEIYVIFEVFAFCGGRTKTDFKDRVEMVLFDMKCLAVLHSQFKDALCLLKIVIILYEHKCTWERSIQQITNVTQKIDQFIGWKINELIN